MSRFVSEGGGSIEIAKDKEDAWKKAQEAVEATKKRQAEAAATGGAGSQADGKSLFETLQANKEAKQSAFEESLRLKNQVQFLNEEDEEYLQSLSKSERDQRASAAKEAREQLAAFRKQQEEAEKRAALGVGRDSLIGKEEETTWSTSAKKRKKTGKDQDLIKGLKLRKTSSTDKPQVQETVAHSAGGGQDASVADNQTVPGESTETPNGSIQRTAVPKRGLGLAAYSSDEDD